MPWVSWRAGRRAGTRAQGPLRATGNMGSTAGRKARCRGSGEHHIYHDRLLQAGCVGTPASLPRGSRSQPQATEHLCIPPWGICVLEGPSLSLGFPSLCCGRCFPCGPDQLGPAQRRPVFPASARQGRESPGVRSSLCQLLPNSGWGWPSGCEGHTGSSQAEKPGAGSQELGRGRFRHGSGD